MFSTLFFFFPVSKNIPFMTSNGSLSVHAFPRLCLHMLRRLPESILVPKSNFIQQDKNKTAHLQWYIHLFQRFKGQLFYVSSVQSGLKLDKNFHVSLLSVQKETIISFYPYTHTPLRDKAGNFLQGLWMVSYKGSKRMKIWAQPPLGAFIEVIK